MALVNTISVISTVTTRGQALASPAFGHIPPAPSPHCREREGGEGWLPSAQGIYSSDNDSHTESASILSPCPPVAPPPRAP